MKEFCSIGTTTDDQIQKDEKVVQIRNLFLKLRNQKRRKKKRKNKSKMKKVWMPKVQVPIACERIEKVEVKHVQRISDSHLSSVKNVRSWKEKKREFGWFNEIFVFQLRSGYYFQRMIDFLQISGCARNQLQS